MCLVALAADPRVIGGPFAVNVTTRSATVAWLAAGDDITLQERGDKPPVQSNAWHVERTTFTGLTPNTRYEYTVPGYGKASFRTAPAATGESVPFRFVVYGDNRTRPAVHQKIIDAIVAHGVPDMVLQSGDMVADGDDSRLWAEFFSIEKTLLTQTAFYPALGNHEHNSHNYYDILQKTKSYYSFDWGKAHFAVLNSDIGNISKVPGERAAFWDEETRWLEEDLRTHQTADYRFVSAHHPPYTAVASRQGDNAHMTALVPMLEKYHVTAGWFGHDHNYQHYLQNGIHYIVSGGGGAPLYDVSKPPANITVKVESTENFIAVDVNGPVAKAQVFNADGKVIDEFELHASPQPKPAAPAK